MTNPSLKDFKNLKILASHVFTYNTKFTIKLTYSGSIAW
jgi:hypothetical protein